MDKVINAEGVEVKVVAPRQNEGGGDWKATLKIEEARVGALLSLIQHGPVMLVSAKPTPAPAAPRTFAELQGEIWRAELRLKELITEALEMAQGVMKVIDKIGTPVSFCGRPQDDMLPLGVVQAAHRSVDVNEPINESGAEMDGVLVDAAHQAVADEVQRITGGATGQELREIIDATRICGTCAHTNDGTCMECLDMEKWEAPDA